MSSPRARAQGEGWHTARNPSSAPHGCARCLTLWVPDSSSVWMETTLAWQGCEGQRDALVWTGSFGSSARPQGDGPVILSMVRPLLHQAVLGKDWSPSALWDKQWPLPSPGTTL